MVSRAASSIAVIVRPWRDRERYKKQRIDPLSLRHRSARRPATSEDLVEALSLFFNVVEGKHDECCVYVALWAILIEQRE